MKLTIVIPAYNEEIGVASIIERCLAQRARIVEETRVDDVEIIVVSDGSTDRTAEIAREHEPEIRVVAYARNRGYGAALKTGFAEGDGDLVSFLDADGTCDPAYFVPMVNKLLEEEADVCIGSRMGPGTKMPRTRRIGNTIFRTIINLVGGAAITDSASGMRVIRRSSLENLYPLPDGLHFTPAMSCRAVLDTELRIVEIAMSYEERMGRSKLSVVGDGLRFLRVIVDIGLIYRPLRFLGATAAIALLPALVYGGGLVASYMSTHAIAEGFLYRMVAVAVFSIVGVQCMMLGVIGERVAQLLHGHDRPRSRVGQVIGSAARPAVAAIVAAVLFAVAIFANRYTIVQYVTTRTVQSHWSFVVFGAFLTILACQFASFAVIDYFIRLLRAHRRERERMRKESREHAS